MRDAAWSVYLEQLWKDISYAVRTLKRSPGFTIVAVLSLALGIGANVAIFSLMNVLILRSLPVRAPQELVAISTISPDGGNIKQPLSLAMLQEMRRHPELFSNLFTWNGGQVSNVEANGVKYPASISVVSGDYFSTLGVQPKLGRLIQPGDVGLDSGHSAPVAVIGYRCWLTRYRGDLNVVGKTFRLEGQPLTIIGVTPKEFVGLIIDGEDDVTVPIGYSGRTTFRDPRSLALNVFARLNPALTVNDAEVRLKAMWPAIQTSTVPAEFQGSRRDRYFKRRIGMESISSGRSYLRERLSLPLKVLMALVGAILLIACVNLANLMLARSAARQHELGVRAALGAGVRRLICQTLTEALVLSFTGAALGMLLATWTSKFLLKMMWNGLVPLAIDPAPDTRVLAFAASVAFTTAIIFGIAPALRAMRSNPGDLLRRNSRTTRMSGAFGKGLISAQIALSIVIVLAAALFVQSLRNIRSTDPGYRTHNILTLLLFQQPGREAIHNRPLYYRNLADKIAHLPGVQAVGYSYQGPITKGEIPQPVVLSASASEPVLAMEETVGPGFITMMGMRVLSGREFSWRDDEHSSRVALVSESFARRMFPEGAAIGRKIDVGPRPEEKGLSIVGVVNSASFWMLQSNAPPAIYLPLLQRPDYNNPNLIIRTTSAPGALGQPAREVLESLGQHYPLRIQTLDQRADDALVQVRMIAMLAGFFGSVALILASIGVYGLMSYAVARRTYEIGVRIALGADRGNVFTLFLREILLISLVGVALGIPAAVAAARLIRGMLFGLQPADPISILLASSSLVGVALLAGYLPARRASHLDPVVALRVE